MDEGGDWGSLWEVCLRFGSSKVSRLLVGLGSVRLLLLCFPCAPDELVSPRFMSFSTNLHFTWKERMITLSLNPQLLTVTVSHC